MQTRDLVYVKDVVRANIIASTHQEAPGHVFNICSGIETSILDLIREIKKQFRNPPNHIFADPRSGDIYRSVGDPRKAQKILGFVPKVQLAEGLSTTVDWMRR